jgi:hypothetical protein
MTKQIIIAEKEVKRLNGDGEYFTRRIIVVADPKRPGLLKTTEISTDEFNRDGTPRSWSDLYGKKNQQKIKEIIYNING